MFLEVNHNTFYLHSADAKPQVSWEFGTKVEIVELILINFVLLSVGVAVMVPLQLAVTIVLMVLEDIGKILIP